jgi:hypothetical protein
MRLQLLPSVLILLAATIVGVSGQADNLPPDPTSAEPDPPQQQIPVADITCMCDPILLAQRGFSCNGMCGDDCANFYKNAMALAKAPECSWSRVSSVVGVDDEVG